MPCWSLTPGVQLPFSSSLCPLAQARALLGSPIIDHHVHNHVHGYYLRWRSLSSSWLRREEIACRFCSSVLPDWKPVLTPPLDDAAAACPTMSVTFNGQVNIVIHAHAYALAPDRPAE